MGLERAGMEIAWQVEVDPWCRKVLAKHWPNVKLYGDIRELTGEELEPVDLICGGFPCQPFSVAGKRKGVEDERWLWPEFARLLRVVRPRYALVENVPGLLSAGMGDVLGDLAEAGYDAEWQSISAASVGAPHLRYRVFIVAYAERNGGQCQVLGNQTARQGSQRPTSRISRSSETMANAQSQRARGLPIRPSRSQQAEGYPIRSSETLSYDDGSRQPVFQGECADAAPYRGTVVGARDWWDVEPNVGRVADGVPGRVDRLRGLGNAVVPQVAEWIGWQIIGGRASPEKED